MYKCNSDGNRDRGRYGDESKRRRKTIDKRRLTEKEEELFQEKIGANEEKRSVYI